MGGDAYRNTLGILSYTLGLWSLAKKHVFIILWRSYVFGFSKNGGDLILEFNLNPLTKLR